MDLPDLSLMPDGARVLIAGPEVPTLPSGHDWTVRETGAELNDQHGNAPFDAVLLLGHLEQSADPVRQLMAARAMLKARGLLYLEVTDGERYGGGHWRIPLKALRRLIEHAGFRVVKRPGRFSLDRFSPWKDRPLRLWCRRY